MCFKKILMITWFIILWSGSCLANDYQVVRLEPPFWWQGFKNTELQLMVYGPAISDLAPSIEYPGVSIKRVERTDNPNYLFIYLDITDAAKAGSFEINFSSDNAVVTHSYTLKNKNPDPAYTRGFSNRDTIYLLTPDRFANGDINNDNAPGMGDEMDRSEVVGRHGGDFRGVMDHLDYISDMGFTSIWMMPVLENRMARSSYHGYSTTDYYSVDPRLGSNEDYKSLTEQARQKGIGMIMDMIANHTGDGHWWMSDLPANDWINFPDEYVESSHEHISVQDPYASNYDRTLFSDGWFVPTMPDLNQRNPLLADYLTQNALWWIEYLGLAGIRMDTYAYMDKDFLTTWAGRIMNEYPHFNIVGEESNREPAIVSYWQRGKNNHDTYVSYLPSVLDFSLQEALAQALVEEEIPDRGGLIKLSRVLANDFQYADPNSLVIFPDNHDMSRIYTQLNEDYDLFKMAMVYVLTMRGIPQIFYGTEILMHNRGTGEHGIIRSDFPGGWPGDQKNAFTGKGLSSREKQAQDFTRQLLNWRKNQPVIHQGKLMQFVPHNAVYAYVRYDDNNKVMAVFNKNEQPVVLDKVRYAEQLAGHSQAVDVLTGVQFDLSDVIEVPARGVLLLDFE